MLSNFYLTHGLILVGAISAAFSIRSESQGRLIRPWRLLLPGVLAAAAGLVLIVYPDISQLLRLDLWTLGVVAILVGAVRGQFVRKELDRALNFVRAQPTRDGQWAANLLVLLAFLEVGAELSTPPDDHTYVPTIELGMVIVGGFLLGRAVAGWIRAGRIQHVDLLE